MVFRGDAPPDVIVISWRGMLRALARSFMTALLAFPLSGGA